MKQVAHPNNPTEFSDHGAYARDQQGDNRNPRPALAKMLTDELAMSFSCDNTQPNGEFLSYDQNRDQNELQQQHAITPNSTALSCRNNATCVCIRKHDNQAWPDDREEKKDYFDRVA